jgi:ABC-type multidrug transport system fused ATPase/permease subunit
MPRTIMGYVLRFTGLHQAALAVLSVAVFLLSAAPLELQRRIVNGLTEKGSARAIFWLAAIYGGVALVEQGLKLMLNVYRAWVAESTVRSLRNSIHEADILAAMAAPSTLDAGVEIAMILEEAEPIGGFTGISISEPLLQGGILASVIGYMFYLQPHLALLGIGFFIPQLVFVPLLQHAINRRAQERILTKREVSGAIAENNHADSYAASQRSAIGRIFTLNMGIYWLKYSMNLLMNLMHHLAVAVAFCVGGWLALEGRIELGTVVAIVGGLGKLNDPWGDLVNWAREFSVVGVKYRLYAEAANWLMGTESRLVEPDLPVTAARG